MKTEDSPVLKVVLVLELALFLLTGLWCFGSSWTLGAFVFLFLLLVVCVCLPCFGHGFLGTCHGIRPGPLV